MLPNIEMIKKMFPEGSEVSCESNGFKSIIKHSNIESNIFGSFFTQPYGNRLTVLYNATEGKFATIVKTAPEKIILVGGNRYQLIEE
jgi:hypothetical protein